MKSVLGCQDYRIRVLIKYKLPNPSKHKSKYTLGIYVSKKKMIRSLSSIAIPRFFITTVAVCRRTYLFCLALRANFAALDRVKYAKSHRADFAALDLVIYCQ